MVLIHLRNKHMNPLIWGIHHLDSKSEKPNIPDIHFSNLPCSYGVGMMAKPEQSDIEIPGFVKKLMT